MRSATLFGFLLLLAFAAVASAQEPKPAEEPQPEGQPQDYSRPTLLYIFSQEDEDDNRPQEPSTAFEYTAKNWTIRWLPFLTPIVTNDSFGTASIMGPVNPFTLLGMSYPETAETYPDRGPQTRYRRKMLRAVTAANRADKAARLRGD